MFSLFLLTYNAFLWATGIGFVIAFLRFTCSWHSRYFFVSLSPKYTSFWRIVYEPNLLLTGHMSCFYSTKFVHKVSTLNWPWFHKQKRNRRWNKNTHRLLTNILLTKPFYNQILKRKITDIGQWLNLVCILWVWRNLSAIFTAKYHCKQKLSILWALF